MRAGAAAVVLLALALASCAGAPRAAREQADYFPLVAGARWLYEVRAGDDRFDLEVVARGPEILTSPGGAGELQVFVMDETLRGGRGWPSTSPVGYLHEGGYVSRLLAIAYDGEGGLRALGQDEPTRMLPLDPRQGGRWTQQHRLFTMPDGSGKRVQWEGEVRGRVAVSVPAGVFEDAVEVRLLYSDPSFAAAGPLVVYLDTYAAGVGLVRSLALDPGGDERRTVEFVLLAFQIPERKDARRTQPRRHAPRLAVAGAGKQRRP